MNTQDAVKRAELLDQIGQVEEKLSKAIVDRDQTFPIIGVGREVSGEIPALSIFTSVQSPHEEVLIRKISERYAVPEIAQSGFPLDLVSGCRFNLLTAPFGGRKYRPIPSGAPIGCRQQRMTGTVGFFVSDPKNPHHDLFLTCKHIFGSPDESVLNRSVYQPLSDGGIKAIGTIISDPLYSPAASYVDCVVVRASVKLTPHYISDSNLRPLKMRGRPHSNPQTNQIVKKSGAAGTANGLVVNALKEFFFPYRMLGGNVSEVRISNSVQVRSSKSAGFNPFALPGDSGSPVFTDVLRRPIGMIYAEIAGSSKGQRQFRYIVQMIEPLLATLGLNLRTF